jgi:hypothetical protein
VECVDATPKDSKSSADISVNPLDPIRGFSFQMRNSNYNNGLSGNTEKDAVRKAVDQATPDLIINEGLELWERDNEPKSLVKFVEKLKAKTHSLLFIPGKGVI